MKTSKSLIKLLCLITGCLFLLGTVKPVSAGEQPSRMRQYVKTQKRFEVLTKPADEQIDQGKVKNREVIIKLKDGAIIRAEELGLEPAAVSPALARRNIIVARIPDQLNFAQKIKELKTGKQGKFAEHIEYIEPNYLHQLLVEPNDEFYQEQWAWRLINLPAAWEMYQGNPEIKVAVIDTGVNHNHPDLENRILPGRYFFDNNSNADTGDTSGHGTKVAGIIAAIANNEIGITGIDWHGRILPIKAGNAEGLGITEIIEGIDFAIEQGAQIINMSFGGKEPNLALEAALWEAYDAGIVLVASSGNNYPDWDKVMYPAAYLPVISVGATDRDDRRAHFSNYGSRLDMAAPGVGILTTGLNSENMYVTGSGTSFAAPIIAGIASLLLGKNQDLTPAEVEWLIESSAVMPDGIKAGEWDSEYGYGRVDAYHTLEALAAGLPDLESDAGNSRETARPLQPNQVYYEKVELPFDEDWFSFRVEQKMDLTIEITAPELIDIVAWLERHQDGEEVWTQVLDNGSAGETEILEFTAEPGVYYLQVFDYNKHWSNTPFTIIVNEVTFLPGDLNDDGVINMLDLFLLAQAYGSAQGEPGFTPADDLNSDGVIDLFDLVLLVRSWGQDI